MSRITAIRTGLATLAALVLAPFTQPAEAQPPWGGSPIRQDYRHIRQDRFREQVDRNQLIYDLNHGYTGAALNDINRLQADQRLLQIDRRQLQYDRSAYNPYYVQYAQPPVQYLQQPPVQYVQQPPVQYVQQPPVQYVQQPPVQYAQPPVQYVQQPPMYWNGYQWVQGY